MKNHIADRPIKCGEYIVENKSTCRETAHALGISESTVHHDVTIKLPVINKQLADRVREVLNDNKNNAHTKGLVKAWDSRKNQSIKA